MIFIQDSYVFCRRAKSGARATIESRWPLYPSESCVEQPREDDQDPAVNLGNIIIGFPASRSARRFCGVELESFPESFTSGLTFVIWFMSVYFCIRF